MTEKLSLNEIVNQNLNYPDFYNKDDKNDYKYLQRYAKEYNLPVTCYIGNLAYSYNSYYLIHKITKKLWTVPIKWICCKEEIQILYINWNDIKLYN